MTLKPHNKYINVLLYIKHAIKYLRNIRRKNITRRRENK